MQLGSDFLCHFLDATHGLVVQFLRRKLYGGIAGMHSSKLYVLGNGVGYYLAFVCHSIHLYLFGSLDEARDDDRMLLTHIGCHLEETLQLVMIGAYIHRCARENVGRTHEYRESYLGYEFIDVSHIGQFLPCWLHHSDAVAHG